MLKYAVLCAFFLVSCTTPEKRDPSGFFDNLFSGSGAKPLSDREVLEASASKDLQVKELQVLVDNDASFDSKIAAIRSAERGETIRMSYYIFSDDASSAVFWQEVISAAKRGVKVKILADLITNYKLMDMFSYLRKEGEGNIDIHFFGSLGPNFLRDIRYLSTPCPPSTGPVTSTTCSNAKWKILEQDTEMDSYARLLLSGALAKSAAALQLAVLEGQQIDLKALQSGASDPAQTEQLVEFLKLVIKSKINRDPIGMAKVSLAYMLYGEQLNPVMNQIQGTLPLVQPRESSYNDWEHVTDFLHHKLLMVGNRWLQLGGRNIENSYHMKPNPLIHRYVFSDVDAIATISRNGDSAAKAFDELWDYKPLVLSYEHINRIAPIDFVMNIDALASGVAECTKGSGFGSERRARVEKCIASKMNSTPGYKDLSTRMTEVDKKIKDGAQAYQSYTKQISETWSPNGDLNGAIPQSDLRDAMVTYIQNVHYDQRVAPEKRERVYGVEPGKELEAGKNLHHLWMRGMENTCAVAAEERKKNPNAPAKQIVLHSAYFLPPGIFMRTLGKMIDGTWDCGNVKVTILSNSFETTDLNVINLLGRYQMTAFYNIYSRRKELFGQRNFPKSAKVEYYELKKTSDKAVSLHAKVMILGDDVIVGSANGDVRSYYMDTNNGLYIRRAPRFIQGYTKWIESQTKNKDLSEALMREFTAGGVPVDQTLRRLHKEDRMMLEAFLDARKFGTKVSRKHREDLHKLMTEVTEYIFKSTRQIVATNFINEEDKAKAAAEQRRVQAMFDRLFQLL